MTPATLTRPVSRQRAGATLDDLSSADRRLYDSIPPEMGYVMHPDFLLAKTEEELFGQDAEEVATPRWRIYVEADEDLAESPSPRRRLTRRQETLLFLRYQYARYRVAKLQGPQARRFSYPRAMEMLVWHRRVLRLRAVLVGANMALVVAMAKRTRINSIDFAELVSEGNMALLRAVEKFDVSRGFKFSTYACRAVLKAFNRMATATATYRQRFPTEFEPGMERSDEIDRRHHDQHALALEDLRRVLDRNTANLTPVERQVVAARFAVGGFERKQTLEEVGSLVGLSKERVRQMQNEALSKLRAALEEQAV